MRLSIPANYDDSILGELKTLGAFEVYGKLPFDVVGGGRPSYMATSLSRRSLAAYVKAVHREGLEFNYLMNAACFGNREWTRAFHRKTDRLLEWLTELKVETLTISAPFLVQVVKKRFPHFKVKAGIYAQVDTVKRAQYWEDLGCDTINLESFSINRDFGTLRAIRAAVKADLVLIANHFCQPNCPYQVQHQNGHAHASGLDPAFYIDYPLIQCQKNRLTRKSLFVSAGWIRPEDIGRYEAAGYSTFKLLERNIPSDALLERARAYHERRYDGNLADILLSWGFAKRAPGFSPAHLLRAFRVWKMPVRLGPTALEFLKGQGMLMYTRERNPIRVDTAAIPADFLDHFERNGSCLDRRCVDCGYCARIAEKAVTIDREFLERILPVYERMEETLVSGKF